jgi:hypothetical protein
MVDVSTLPVFKFLVVSGIHKFDGVSRTQPICPCCKLNGFATENPRQQIGCTIC